MEREDIPMHTSTLCGAVMMRGSEDGKGSTARFFSPDGICCDNHGFIFVIDRNNHTIRKINSSDGTVTTLCGSPLKCGSSDGTGSLARFNYPHGICCDNQGFLFVADYENHTIRKINTKDGTVTTLCGVSGVSGSINGQGSTAKFNCPYGICYDNRFLFIVEHENHTIRKIDPIDGTVTSLCGATGEIGSTDGKGISARFNFPVGICCDNRGFIYVTEYKICMIRKINSMDGTVTTLCGPLEIKTPIGICCDDNGFLFVTDFNNHIIRKINTKDGTGTTICGVSGVSGSINGEGNIARFHNPSGICCDKQGVLFVSEYSNHSIRQLANSIWTTKYHHQFSTFVKKQILTLLLLTLKSKITNKPLYSEVLFYKLPKDILFAIAACKNMERRTRNSFSN